MRIAGLQGLELSASSESGVVATMLAKEVTARHVVRSDVIMRNVTVATRVAAENLPSAGVPTGK